MSTDAQAFLWWLVAVVLALAWSLGAFHGLVGG
jgi:hypothetical protein